LFNDKVGSISFALLQIQIRFCLPYH